MIIVLLSLSLVSCDVTRLVVMWYYNTAAVAFLFIFRTCSRARSSIKRNRGIVQSPVRHEAFFYPFVR
jgi:hypothetical protein